MGRWGVWLCFIEFVKYSTTKSPTPLPLDPTPPLSAAAFAVSMSIREIPANSPSVCKYESPSFTVFTLTPYYPQKSHKAVDI